MTIHVLLSGLPGNMATEAARELLNQEDIELLDLALTGSRDKTYDFHLDDRVFQLTPPISPHYRKSVLREVLRNNPDLIVVDFSKAPMEENGVMYAELSIPFIYGGTIGNRRALEDAVRKYNSPSSIIAPNLSLALNLFPGTPLQYLVKEFPGSFNGWKAKITESHQASKTDVSGTAKVWKTLLEELGMEVEIESIRDLKRQLTVGVPKEYLGGHAYHLVTLYNRDEGVELGFYTKVHGRRTYAKGTATAVRYLHRRSQEGSRGEVFSVLDVLRGM